MSEQTRKPSESEPDGSDALQSTLDARERELNHDREVDTRMRARTRRSALVGGLSALAGLGLFEWIHSRRPDLGQPWPLRRVLDLNEGLWRDYFSRHRSPAEFPPEDVDNPLRLNERIGMDDPLDPADWKLVVDGFDTDQDEAHAELGMDSIRKLPKVEQITALCCIEGWNRKAHWAGARFADLAKQYPPPPECQYVGLETPDGEYYVGLDLESAMQPQTLLAYELNGEPLPEPHGAPLRLAIPVKYGIKNLKRIGRIFYSQERPRDYWAERGYDWYAGL